MSSPQQCRSLAAAVPPPLHRVGVTNGGYAMLLPFDLRPDREGWTVFDIETDLPAFLDGFPLTGLSLDDAEEAVNALNALEFSCWQAARRHVLDERCQSSPE